MNTEVFLSKLFSALRLFATIAVGLSCLLALLKLLAWPSLAWNAVLCPVWAPLALASIFLGVCLASFAAVIGIMIALGALGWLLTK